MATFKITVPQKGAANANGTEVKLYSQNEMIDAKANWEKELMDVFVENGWAVETKMQSVADVEVTEPVITRSTQKVVTKKKTTKKTTKKKSQIVVVD